MIPTIGFLDITLGFLFLLNIYFCAFRFQKSKIQKNDTYRFLIWELTAKIIGDI
jgi:hypothetical protein